MTVKEPENIRTYLGEMIGLTILDITEDDWEDVIADDPEERTACVYVHLSNGETMAFRILGPAGFCYPVQL